MKYLKKQSLFLYPDKASILIVAIWTLTIFTILSAAVYKITSSHLKVAKVLEQRLSSYYAAVAAALHAKWQIKKDRTFYDTPLELRTAVNKKLGKAEFTYTMIDEESKINVNTAGQEVLRKLPGFNVEIAESIANSSLRPFSVKEQLLLIDDVTYERFKDFERLITVYGKGKVNINTAPEEVLTALGMDESLIRLIRRYRAGTDAKEATSDDWAFKNTHSIVEDLRSFAGLTSKQEQTLIKLIGQELLDVKSDNFCLDLQTKFLDKPSLKYSIVLDKKKIKQWKEY